MQSVYLIFDYFKETFHINRKFKVLYKPQIALILIKLLMIIAISIELYMLIGTNVFFEKPLSFDSIVSFPLIFIASVISMFLIFAVASCIVEAGLYNMYKQSVVYEVTQMKDFWQGVRKYSFKILLGNILIIAAWIAFAAFYIVVGIITLSVGFAIIPIIVHIFLTMWKVSLVMNDTGILAAISDSIKFAKDHFLPLAGMQLINWSFTQGVGSKQKFMGRMFQWKVSEKDVSFLRGLAQSISSNITLERIIAVGKVAAIALLHTIAIASVIGALIKMVFEVFFTLALFVAYSHRFELSEQATKEEAI